MKDGDWKESSKGRASTREKAAEERVWRASIGGTGPGREVAGGVGRRGRPGSRQCAWGGASSFREEGILEFREPLLLGE